MEEKLLSVLRSLLFNDRTRYECIKSDDLTILDIDIVLSILEKYRIYL